VHLAELVQYGGRGDLAPLRQARDGLTAHEEVKAALPSRLQHDYGSIPMAWVVQVGIIRPIARC
jgi:hypothetical protein